LTPYPLRSYQPAGVTIQGGLLRIEIEDAYRQPREIYCGALDDIVAVVPERLSKPYQQATLAWRTVQLGLFLAVILIAVHGTLYGWERLWENWPRRREAILNQVGLDVLFGQLAAAVVLLIPGWLRSIDDLTRFNLRVRRRLVILYTLTELAGEIVQALRWANLPCPEWAPSLAAADRPLGVRRVLLYCAIIFVPMFLLMFLTNGSPLSQAEWVTVPVARRDLSVGTRLDGAPGALLAEIDFRRGQEPAGAIRPTAALKDWVLALPLPAGQPVTTEHLEPRTLSITAGVLGERVQQGQRVNVLQRTAENDEPMVVVGPLRVLRVEHFPDQTCFVDLEAYFPQYGQLDVVKNNKQAIYVARAAAP
jgi:hypothetical protein